MGTPLNDFLSSQEMVTSFGILDELLKSTNPPRSHGPSKGTLPDFKTTGSDARGGVGGEAPGTSSTFQTDKKLSNRKKIRKTQSNKSGLCCVCQGCDRGYCTCFQGNLPCSKNCISHGCTNGNGNSKAKEKRKKQFLSSVSKSSGLGCQNCSTGCNSGYCPCHKNGKGCGTGCKCLEPCYNRNNHGIHQYPPIYSPFPEGRHNPAKSNKKAVRRRLPIGDSSAEMSAVATTNMGSSHEGGVPSSQRPGITLQSEACGPLVSPPSQGCGSHGIHALGKHQHSSTVGEKSLGKRSRSIAATENRQMYVLDSSSQGHATPSTVACGHFPQSIDMTAPFQSQMDMAFVASTSSTPLQVAGHPWQWRFPAHPV